MNPLSSSLTRASRFELNEYFPLEKGVQMRIAKLSCSRISKVICRRAFYCGRMSSVLLPKDNRGPCSGKENGTMSNPVKAKDQSLATKRSRSEEQSSFRVKKLTENAILPVRGSAGAAGYDLARLNCHLLFQSDPCAESSMWQ